MIRLGHKQIRAATEDLVATNKQTVKLELYVPTDWVAKAILFSIIRTLG